MGPKLYLPLALLFLASADPSRAQSEAQPPSTTAPAAGAEPPSTLPPKLQYFDVGRPFALNCTTSVAGGYQWRVNGTAIEEVAALKDRYALEEGGAVLRVGVHARTHEDDFGEYVCGIAGVTEAAAVFDVRGRPVVKLQPNSNVVEGQKLRLVCKLVGKPYPAVEWRRRNGSADLDDGDVPPGVPVAAVMGARAHLNASEQGVSGAELVVDPAERSDAGVYQCAPLSEEGVAAETTLRVKDKYAALWPFLGICAEVFVLCAIILIYERRRSKPELDDSDTDNHDQKKS